MKKRPTGAVVRTLTPKDVREVLAGFGFYLLDSAGGTATAIAIELNGRLMARPEEPTK